MTYLIGPDGRYVSTLSGTAQEILAQIPEGYTVTQLSPPRLTDYWDGASWISIGPAPEYYMVFDYETKKWKDARDIESVRQSKWNQIKLERNMKEFSGFDYNGNHYDSDQISQGRILAAFIFGKPVNWTLSNNEVVELTVEDLQGLAAAMATHIEGIHEQSRLARELIYSSTTIEEIEAVTFM